MDDLDQRLPQILQRLRGDARRITTPRRRILEVLLASEGHMDIEQIRSAASRGTRRISYATVYRTMRMLVDAGLVHERHFQDEPTCYEYQRADGHHDHLICTGCGGVVEFLDPVIEERQQQIAGEHDYVLTGHRHEVYGLCASCRRAAGRSAPGEKKGRT